MLVLKVIIFVNMSRLGSDTDEEAWEREAQSYYRYMNKMWYWVGSYPSLGEWVCYMVGAWRFCPQCHWFISMSARHGEYCNMCRTPLEYKTAATYKRRRG